MDEDAAAREQQGSAFVDPAIRGRTPDEMFGNIVATDDSDYSGNSGGVIPFEAASAFAGGGSSDTITGIAAAGVTGRDGNFWKNVG